ncbi:MAG TPA: DUF4384 domain-containing protein [Firmicutes bacterium]|nr:DUF4384 domain-containing protein [Bacillota bacterium]
MKHPNRRCRRWLLAAALVLVLAVIPAAGRADEPKLKLFVNPTPAFSAQVWVDRGEGSTYFPGENVRISFRTTRDCYVYILDIDPSGAYRWLLPSVWWKNNYVRANQTRTLPEGSYELTVAGPPGIEQIYIFASTRQLDMPYLEYSLRSGQFAPRIEANAEIIQKEIKARIQIVPSTYWVSDSTYFYVGSGAWPPAVTPPPAPQLLGAVNVSSSPSGARVFLDGQERGYTPIFIRDVPLGEHEVVLIMRGYHAVVHPFNVSYPGTFYITRNLQRIE